MARPSRSLDQKLIDSARALLPRRGVSGLSVRQVCRRAGVNLGMFHYHFKSKDAFIRRLLQETYDDFFVTFRDAAEGPGDARERLRRVLIAFARFARDHRPFYALLARELLNEQKQCLDFIRRNFPRHASLLFALLDECRREGLVRPLPTPMLGAFAMMSMGTPNILLAALERRRPRRVRGTPFAQFVRMMLSDSAIEARVDMVLAALAAQGRP